MAFTAGNEVQIVAADGSTVARHDLGHYVNLPRLSPDGRHLAASRSVNYSYSVYLLDSMGDKPVALTTSGDWYAPAWSR